MPESKLSKEITSPAPEGGAVCVRVAAAVEPMVGTTAVAVGEDAGTPVDVGPVVGDEAGPVDVGPTAVGDEGGRVDVGPAVGEEAEPVDVGPTAVGDEGGRVDVGPTVGGSGVKVFVAVGTTVAVRVAVAAGGCVRVGVGFVPVVPTQLALPESVKL